jgi:putative NADH-flavin reductase
MSQEKTVVVFGATGKVGKLFIQQALDADHTPRALVRNAAKLEPGEHPRLEAVVGDATKHDDVAKIVAGADVVVSCLGNVGKHHIMLQSFENILAAAAAQPTIPRCLFITTVGCGGTSWLIKQMLILIGRDKASIQDYDRADRRVLDETMVPCVLVRPYALTDKQGSGKYYATEKQNATFMRPIARADVATFLVDAVVDKRWDRKPGIQLGGKK